MKIKTLVIGCGIGGLSAGAALKEAGETDFLIVDRTPDVPLNLHNGVHYLHANDFGTPFPFEFKEITSTEEIWDPRKDTFKKQAHIPEMIDYSLKVMNLRHPSSIMDPGSRPWKTYVPLSNNMNDLLVAYRDYIGLEKFKFNMKLVKVNTITKTATFNIEGINVEIEYENLIETVPLNVFEKLTGTNFGKEFKFQKLYIANYKTTGIVPNWLISMYISDDREFPPYRITILNNIISMESLKEMSPEDEHIVHYHLKRYFDYELSSKESYAWDTGRIWGLSKPEREEVLKHFESFGIYPIGRYGQWDGKLTMDTTIIQAKELVNKLTKE